MKISVVVVSDDPGFLEALGDEEVFEENHMEVSDTISSFSDLLPGIELMKPQLVLLDMKLTGDHTLRDLKIIKNAVPGCRVILVGQNEKSSIISRLLGEGASGYFEKPLDILTVKTVLKSMSEKIRRVSKELLIEDAHISMQSLYLWELMEKDSSLSNDPVFINHICGTNFHSGLFQVVFFKLDEIHGKLPMMERDRYYLDIRSVQRRIKKNTSMELYDICYEMIFDFRFDGVVAIINYAPSDEEIILDKLEKIRNLTAQNTVLGMEMTLTVCVGKAYEEFRRVRDSKREAYQAAWERISMGTGKVIVCFDKHQVHERHIQKMEQILEHLDLMAQTLSREGIHNDFNDLFALPETVLSTSQAKELILHFIHTFFEINRTILNTHMAVNEEQDQLEKAVHFSTNMCDLKEMLLEKFDNMIVLLSDDMEKQNIRSLRKAIRYIKDNYSSQLTANVLAEVVNLNPVYFGHLFKLQTGMNLTDYITDYRMNIAKTLLFETDMPINEVAEATGFRDQRYFSKRFKQLEGKTPSEFRKMK